MQPNLIRILQDETEGIVRKEGVILFTVVFEQCKVPADQLDNVYNALAFSAVNDLFWEVKVKAIEFWHSVIKRELSQLGVIDGCFPSATFSKTKKKIITLTHKEITERLTNLLDKTASIGCLGVLISCLRDEEDLMVVKASVNVLKSLYEFLRKYNYWNHHKATHGEPKKNTSETLQNNVSNNEYINAIDENMELDDTHSDEVIESIVLSQDISLLSDAYVKQMNVNSPVSSEEDIEKFREKVIMTTEDFVNKMMCIDLDEIVKNRTEWMAQADSFETLLSDMMDALQVTTSNEADCY